MTRASDTRPQGGNSPQSEVPFTGSTVPQGMRPKSYRDFLKPHPAFPLPFANRTPIRLGKALGKAA